MSVFSSVLTTVKFIKVLFIHQLEAPVSCLKKTILKFTLKQLGNVSVLQIYHYQGAH